jgi:hypothetical protein
MNNEGIEGIRTSGASPPSFGNQSFESMRLPDELFDRGGHREFPAPDQPLEQFGHERMQPVGPDPAAGLPQDLGCRGDGGAVAARAPSARGPQPGPWGAAEQPDGGFAMHARHGNDLVQQLVLLGSRGVLVSLPLHSGVLPQAARVTVPSWSDLVTVTSDLRGLSR